MFSWRQTHTHAHTPGHTRAPSDSSSLSASASTHTPSHSRKTSLFSKVCLVVGCCNWWRCRLCSLVWVCVCCLFVFFLSSSVFFTTHTIHIHTHTGRARSACGPHALLRFVAGKVPYRLLPVRCEVHFCCLVECLLRCRNTETALRGHCCWFMKRKRKKVCFSASISVALFLNTCAVRRSIHSRSQGVSAVRRQGQLGTFVDRLCHNSCVLPELFSTALSLNACHCQHVGLSVSDLPAVVVCADGG